MNDMFDLSSLIPSNASSKAASDETTCTSFQLVPAQGGLVLNPASKKRANVIDGKTIADAEAWLDEQGHLYIYVETTDGSEYKLAASAATGHTNLTHMVKDAEAECLPLYIFNNKDRKVPHVNVTATPPRSAQLASRTVNKRF